jgi:hypothetical protein
MLRLKARALACIVASACLCSAPPAHACRQLVVRSAELAEIDTVVLVTVETAERIKEPGFHTWRLTARGVANIDGSPNSRRYEFNSTLKSNGCDGTPPPRGEEWVIYLGDSPNGGVLHAFPLAYVTEHDRRLAKMTGA